MLASGLTAQLVAASDPALEKAVDTLQRLGIVARGFGMEEAPEPGELGKSHFYPQLGRVKNLKSFQIHAADGAKDDKSRYWWVEVSSDGQWVHQISFAPTVSPQREPHQPKWSENQASQIALKFLQEVGGSKSLNVKQVQVEYKQQLGTSSESTAYLFGTWRLTFQRFTRHGHPVLGDSVTVKIHESQGLCSYADQCLTEIDEAQLITPLIVLEKAQLLAVEQAKLVLSKSPQIRIHFGEFRLEETPVRSELAVVRPNNILECSDLAKLDENPAGALAWVFTFALKHKSNKLVPGVMRIYIDCRTGKLLGGVA
jgi:hypothetical protein